MNQTKPAFPWDSMTRIFGPEIMSDPRQLLQKPELIESYIRDVWKRHTGKPDIPRQKQPGYRIRETPEHLVVYVPIPPATPRRNLSVRANSRSIRLQGPPGGIDMYIALPALVNPRLTRASFRQRTLRIACRKRADDRYFTVKLPKG